MDNKAKIRAFAKFCDETSLHGLPYLNREMSKTWKMIWIFFIIFIWIISSYVIVINVQHHLDATTMTTIESVMASLSDVTFPSVYICNINQVSILSTFYARVFVRKFIQSQDITRKKAFIHKICTFNGDEIDHTCQFHQHFTRRFYAHRFQKRKKLTA
jgi:hypothetical protein